MAARYRDGDGRLSAYLDGLASVIGRLQNPALEIQCADAATWAMIA